MPDWIFVRTPEVGRLVTSRAPFDPKTLVRTICPLVRLPGGRGRISDFPGQSGDDPLDGTDPASLADELNGYAELGIGHAILVIDPVTATSIAGLRAVLDRLDA